MIKSNIKNGILLNDVIDDEHCYFLEKHFFNFKENFYEEDLRNLKIHSKNTQFYDKYVETEKENNWCSFDNAYKFIKENPLKQFSINETYTHDVISNLTNLISDTFKEKIQFYNSHIRLYRNGSKLPKHYDRKNLDITLSVNIGGLQNWPICISNKEIDDGEEFTTFVTPRKSGVASYGRRYKHWRDPLICGEEEYVLQIFYHWKIIE